jgi:hypothetical protein
LLVEQSTKFELISKWKAAEQIGLTIPHNVLARADRGHSVKNRKAHWAKNKGAIADSRAQCTVKKAQKENAGETL